MPDMRAIKCQIYAHYLTYCKFLTLVSVDNPIAAVRLAENNYNLNLIRDIYALCCPSRLDPGAS
ncbi:hypothetical protein GCM10027181_11740 [Rheinheimera gaetbuli]